jgi:hypothetical protein
VYVQCPGCQTTVAVPAGGDGTISDSGGGGAVGATEPGGAVAGGGGTTVATGGWAGWLMITVDA